MSADKSYYRYTLSAMCKDGQDGTQSRLPISVIVTGFDVVSTSLQLTISVQIPTTLTIAQEWSWEYSHQSGDHLDHNGSRLDQATINFSATLNTFIDQSEIIFQATSADHKYTAVVIITVDAILSPANECSSSLILDLSTHILHGNNVPATPCHNIYIPLIQG